MHYINVVIDSKNNNTDTFYTYAAPDEAGIGARVTVPFARRKKPVNAYCVEEDVETALDPSKIKEIESYDPKLSLNREMIETALWMRKRYGVRYIDAIKLFQAPGKREPKRSKKEDTAGDERWPVLSAEQQAAADNICRHIGSGEFRAYLLKGVTNSGKTEVYMKAVEKALSQGRTAMILLPEIALSAQVQKRFEDRFGSTNVATLHSKLTTSARHREWLRLRRGEAKIVVGARTSVFAPLDNIGVIVIDEEHEATFKSDHNPKYETADVAYRRASAHGAVLISGSATPSIVSYNRAANGIYELIEMKHRIGDSIMPQIDIVDMRKEAAAGNTSVISRRLASAIDETLKNKEQVILFLNRRGFSTQILCPDCGYRMTCDDCGISLTYHKSVNAAVCHYCGRRYSLPEVCPDCGSRFIRYVGAGTEKVEETVHQLWPDAGIARFDLDTATSEEETEKVIDDFQKGCTDILVGTQILAKGLDFKNVGLVGIINADVSLNIPDYRSSERTYQLITQVAGRAGRDGGSSSVFIQTYEPESEVILEAAASDYESFYESELLHRRIMYYPPYSDIISVGFVSEDEDEAKRYAEAFRNRLCSLRSAPSEAVILRTKTDERRTDGYSRARFLIKAPPGSRSGYVQEYMKCRDMLINSKAKVFIDIDINPYGIV